MLVLCQLATLNTLVQHVQTEGGDMSEVRSSLLCVGIRLEEVVNTSGGPWGPGATLIKRSNSVRTMYQNKQLDTVVSQAC